MLVIYRLAATFCFLALLNGNLAAAPFTENLTITATAPVSSVQLSIDKCPNPCTVAANSTFSVSVVKPNAGGRDDWLSLAPAGSSGTTFITWQYLNGLQTDPPSGIQTADLTFTAPSTPGNYEFHFMPNNVFVITATLPFTVSNGPPPVAITVNGSTGGISVNEGAALSIVVTNGPGNPTDIVDIASAAAPNTKLSWDYLNGTKTAPATGLTSATLSMVAPSTPGNYLAQFIPNNGTTITASAAFTVTGPPPPPSPVMTVTPGTVIGIPDTTPLGATVASYSVVMSDGSPYTRTGVTFGQPNLDAGGRFVLQASSNAQGKLILNPTGPGIVDGSYMVTLTAN
jgi:hypothetical protein